MKPGRFRRAREFDFSLDGLELDARQRREISDRVQNVVEQAQKYGHGVGFEHGADEALTAINTIALGARVR